KLRWRWSWTSFLIGMFLPIVMLTTGDFDYLIDDIFMLSAVLIIFLLPVMVIGGFRTTTQVTRRTKPNIGILRAGYNFMIIIGSGIVIVYLSLILAELAMSISVYGADFLANFLRSGSLVEL